MDLHSGSPFWVVKNGLIHSYPRLQQNLQCDVLVVGAGISGALIGDHLSRSSMSVCVIESREAGWGSTSASTALLQYEIDSELQELSSRYGEADAVLAYRACEQAIGSLHGIAKSLRGIEFQTMQSLYFASRWYHKSRLENEAALRKANGFKLQLLDRTALQAGFGINAPAGILTPVAAQTDPYQFTHRLLDRIQKSGGHIHARTTLNSFKSVRGGVHAETDTGMIIRCKQLILAAGYESQTWLDQKVASNHSSYAFISEPLPRGLGILKKTLVWESARPYLYMRGTADDRLLVGGLDDKLDIAIRRDARVAKKSEKLCLQARKLFPQLPIEIAFAWAGTFAETDDGLPFFGTHEQYGPRIHFAMAYGGNGITYSQIGAELLRDSLLGNKHPCKLLFSFDRLKRN